MHNWTDNLEARQTVGVIALNTAALVAFACAPVASEYPLGGVSILAFLLIQVFCPSCRLYFTAPLCPANIAQCLFWVQLVLVPLLIGYYDISLGTLPELPSHQAIDTAICLRIVGYVSFCVAYQCFFKPVPAQRDPDVHHQPDPFTQGVGVPFMLIAACAALGLVGCFLFYRGIDGFIEYVSSPIYQRERELEEATLAGAAGNLLRHFLGFAVILAWSWWIVGNGQRRSAAACVVVTGLAAVVLLAANFTYNRGTTLAPALALAAAYSLHVRRISFSVVALASAVVLVVAFSFGWYRSSDLKVSDVSAEDIGTTWDGQQMVDFLQIYASGPQLTAYLIDDVEFENKFYYGKTLLPSVLYPIPVLGKPYREMSGVVIFNASIYGEMDVFDQIIAYDSELYINFLVPGVVVGYFFLGWLLTRFQSRFLQATNPVESYAWLLLALWTVFPGSIAVTSQSYFYSFWPIYLYALIKLLSFQARRTNDCGLLTADS